MVRLYGKAPYKIVLVHGGPGAIGSLKGFAQKLAELSQIGVVEALQSKYSIAELIEELYMQIKDNCSDRVTLVGHSWGAWLVVLFAEKYPELIEHVILIGCGPLEEKYVPEIGTRRFQNLSEEEGAIFQRLIDNQATNEDMEKIPNIFEKSDNYCLENREEHRADRTDSEMHNKVWGEAAKLRSSGKLLTSFKNIKSKLYLIQGQVDPHPVKGVTIPLQENEVLCETYVLEKCGHSPFMEKYAKDEFYKILMQIFNKSYMLPKFEMCMECYVDENRATPLLNPLDCLKNHTQYICGTCGRCICIEHDPKRGLQRWQFPFKSLEIAKLYLRTADYSMKKACGIYELKDENGRLSYKIFADSEGLRLYLQKNKGKTCKDRKPVFMMEEYREYANTQVRKLTSDEIQKYMSER